MVHSDEFQFPKIVLVWDTLTFDALFFYFLKKCSFDVPVRKKYILIRDTFEEIIRFNNLAISFECQFNSKEYFLGNLGCQSIVVTDAPLKSD